MKEELGTAGAVAGMVVLACLFGGLALAIYPGWHVIVAALPKQSPAFDFVNFFSALGSCGAAVAAVWIGLKQNSQRRRDDELRAQLVAANISVRLQMFSLRLHTLSLTQGFESLVSANPYDEEFVTLQNWLKESIYRPTDAELAALVTLPNQAANRLARGYEVLSVLAQRVEPGGALERSFHRAQENRKMNIMDKLYDEVQTADHMIAVGTRECIEAAKVGAPYPSTEELYD